MDYNGPFFYPDPVFGWTFYAVLLGFLAVATYTDVGTLKIPKALTLPMLGAGLVFSMVRGAWMGSLFEASDAPGHVWLFARSPVLGALDGLLCSLAGFVAAFVLFLVLYRLGVMRGGDLKLAAALGAWLGPVLVLIVILATVPILLLLGTALLIRKIFRRGIRKTAFNVKGKALGDNLKKAPGGKRRAEVLLAYSLPVALSAGLLLPFLVVRDQHHPVPPKNETPNEQVSVQP
jgi:prepilin peptidase CpaA